MSGAALPRVLVAADRETHQLVSQALKDEFEVMPAAAGQEALEKIASGEFECILLDVNLPGLNALDVCRRLKSERRTASIPVLFVRSLKQRADEAQGFEVGAADYITAPVPAAIVKARVRTHVELKRLRERFEQLELVDSVTGLANRVRFDAAIDSEWRRTARAGRWLSIAIVDVDHLKRFVDRHGPPAGDKRLQTVAESLARNARRAGDLVARYDAEQFAVILPEIDAVMMQGMMRIMMAGVVADGARADAGREGDPVTVSVGAVSVVPGREKTIAAALAAADRLLNEAKRAGRDQGVHLDLSSLSKTVVRRS